MQSFQLINLCQTLQALQPNKCFIFDANQNLQIVDKPNYSCFWKFVYWLGRCVGYKNYPKIKSIIALTNKIFLDNQSYFSETRNLAHIVAWRNLLLHRPHIIRKAKPEFDQLNRIIHYLINQLPITDQTRIQREIAGKLYQLDMNELQNLIKPSQAFNEHFECGHKIAKVRIPKACYAISEVYSKIGNEKDIYGAKIAVQERQFSHFYHNEEDQEIHLMAKDGTKHTFHSFLLSNIPKEEKKERKDKKETKKEITLLDCTKYSAYSIKALKVLLYGYTQGENNKIVIPLVDFISLWHLADHLKCVEISQLCVETFKDIVKIDTQSVLPRIIDFYLFAFGILKLPFYKESSLCNALTKTLKQYPKYEQAIQLLLVNGFKVESIQTSSEGFEKIRGYLSAYQELTEETEKSKPIEEEI